MTAAPVPRTAFRDVLAEPRFRLLFGTRSLAIAADTLRIVALSVLVFAVTGSPLLAAVAYGIGFLPQLAGSMLFGALADRVRPRRLIAAGYCLECATGLALALARLPVAASLALVAVVAAVTPVFGGAATRLTAEVLTGDAYVVGRSLSNMASSGAQLLGLAGAGIAVAGLGARHALLLSAGCHLVAALAVRLRLPDLPVVAAGGGPGSTLGSSWRGNAALLADARIRVLLLAQWLPPAFVTGAEGLIVGYAARRGFPSSAPGLLLACLPVGMLAGDGLVGRLVRPANRERLVVPLVVLMGLPLTAVVANPPPAVLAVLLVATGGGFAYALGLQRAFLDAVPAPRRGQSFGLLSAGLMTVQGVSPAVFGALTGIVPVGAAMAAAGAATLATGGYLVWALPGQPAAPAAPSGVPEVPAPGSGTRSGGTQPDLASGVASVDDR